MIKVSTLLIFHPFFQNLILKVIWSYYMKKRFVYFWDISSYLFCFMTMSSDMLSGWQKLTDLGYKT